MRKLLCLILLVLAGTSCRLEKAPKQRKSALLPDTVPPPQKPVDAFFRGGARVDFWQSDTLTWRMVTKTLRQDPTSQRVWAEPVDLTAFTHKGDIAAHIVADSGTMDRGMRFFHARGHVVGSNKTGMELETDSIVFDKESDRIHTNARVRVKTENGDVLTGKGFRSDAYLNRWEILSDIRGQFKDLGSFPFVMPNGGGN